MDIGSLLRSIAAGVQSNPIGAFLTGRTPGAPGYTVNRAIELQRGPGVRTVPRSNAIVKRGRFARPVAQQQATANPSDILLQQLLGMLSQPPSTVDESDLMRQIQSQINPVFDARTQTLRDLMAAAEQRTATGRRDVENMYGALSRDYIEMLPEVREQAQQATEATQNLYGELKSNIEGNYARIQQEQADLFQQLGIEEAAPAVLEDQATQQLASLNAAESSGAANVQRTQDIGNIDESYYRQGAPLATLEGSNRSADLLTQLNDYLAQQSSAINELEAMRASETSSAFNQLLGQSTESAQSQQRWQQEQLIRILMGQMESQQPGESMLPDSLQYLQQSGLQPNDQQDVWNALRSIQGSSDVVTGRQFDPEANTPGERTRTTTERIYQLAREYAEENRLSPQELEVLLLMIQLQYGS